MKKNILVLAILCLSIAQAQNFDWAEKFESNKSISIYDTVTDKDDNIYTVGSFKGTVDFHPFSSNAYFTRTAIQEDLFVIKKDPTGFVSWFRTLSGNGIERANSVAISPNGNVQITGGFQGTVTFDPPGVNLTNIMTSNGGMDAFILTLNKYGQYINSVNIGGTGNDEGMAIVSNGHNYVTGYFSGTNSPTGIDFAPLTVETSYTLGVPSTYINSNGGTDIFTVRLRETGSFVWAKASGGPGQDKGEGIALAPKEGVYITGHFQGVVNFNASFSGAPQVLAGGPLFLQRIHGKRGRSIWAKRIQGQFDSHNNCIASTPDKKNVYLTGKFNGNKNFGTTNTPKFLNAWGGNDIFILRHTQFGNLIWAKQISGFSDQEAHAIRVNECFEVYIGGSVGDLTDLNPSPSSPYFISANNREGFIVKLLPNGGFSWGQILNASFNADIRALAVDTKGSVIATGSFAKGIAPSGITPLTISPFPFTGGRPSFITKLDMPILTSIQGPADVSKGKSCDVNIVCPTVGASKYTWQIESTPGNWTPIIGPGLYAGYNTSTLFFSGSSVQDNKRFRCIVSFPCVPDNWGEPATFTLTSDFCTPNKNEPITNEEHLNISQSKYIAYPNPFNSDLTLRVDSKIEEKLSVSIYDISGRSVYESNNYMTNEPIYLNLELQAGIYTIRFTHGNTIEQKKMIKK